jgi:hypothetical protein
MRLQDRRAVRRLQHPVLGEHRRRHRSWKKDSANLGSDALWRKKESAACALEILDENGVLIVSRGTGTTIGYDEEQCRTSVRELAKKFYAAVQP